MSALIVDVLPLVFSELAEADLASCCLVERSWTPLAQKKLYHEQSFAWYKDFHPFEESIRHHPHLRPLVKSLELYLDPESPNPDPPRPVQREDLESILRLATDLEDLSVGDLVTLGGENDGARGAMASLKGLRSLYLWTGNAGEIDSYDGAAFARLLGCWTNFSALKLKGTAFKTHDWTATTTCKAHLASVDLFGVLVTDGELEQLLSNSSESLTTFHHIEIPVKPLSSIFAGLAGFFGGSNLPPPGAPPSPPRITSAVFQSTLTGKVQHAHELSLGIESLTPEALTAILEAAPSLRLLGIPFTALSDDVLIHSSPTLTALQLYHLPKSEIITEEATRKAVALLDTCALAGIKKIYVWSFYTASMYAGMKEEIEASCARRAVEVSFKSRYFHE